MLFQLTFRTKKSGKKLTLLLNFVETPSLLSRQHKKVQHKYFSINKFSCVFVVVAFGGTTAVDVSGGWENMYLCLFYVFMYFHT